MARRLPHRRPPDRRAAPTSTTRPGEAATPSRAFSLCDPPRGGGPLLPRRMGMKARWIVAMAVAAAAWSGHAVTAHAQASALGGLWDATVSAGGVEVPFRMELSASGSTVKGTFFNGDERMTSSSGTFQNGALAL